MKDIKNTITVKAHGLSPSIKPTPRISAGVKFLNLESKFTGDSTTGFSLADDFNTNEIGHTILDSIVEDYEVVGESAE